MQRNIIEGNEFMLFDIDENPVAYSKNVSLSIKQSLIDVTSKDSQGWAESITGSRDFSLSFDGLVSYDKAFDVRYFTDSISTGTPFFIKLGVLQSDFEYSYWGEVSVENIEISAQKDEITSYSGSLKGIGALQFTNSGSPQQSGYIKTETDPIFVSSPSYNITSGNISNWNEAYNKKLISNEFSTAGNRVTLTTTLTDGSKYSAGFNYNLSGYYNQQEIDDRIAVAQQAANTANDLIDDIASDSKLTPSEKPNVLKEWQIIFDEYPKITSQAQTYGVETLGYDISFIQLDEYLDDYLFDLTTTSNINGNEFRTMFRSYYDSKVLLLKDIGEAQKNYVDNISFGLRNYFFNGDKSVYINATNPFQLQDGNFANDSEFAISFNARSTSGLATLLLNFYGSESHTFLVNNDWGYYTFVSKTTQLPRFYACLAESMTNDLDFPYTMPINLNFGVELKEIMIVAGNKPIKFSNAPEDFYQLINDAKAEAVAVAGQYTQAQTDLAKIEAAAYADGKIDQLEQINIDLAQQNLIATKAYADAQDLYSRTIAAAYADGKITIEEQARINSVAAVLASAKTYAEAQKALAIVVANAYADGIVTETEQAFINIANGNLAAAKLYAEQQSALAKEVAAAYADGKISAEEQARITAVQNAVNAAQAYTVAQRNLSEITTQAYADGIVSAEEARAIADAQAKLDLAKAYALAQANAVKQELIVIIGDSIAQSAADLIAKYTSAINVANTAALNSAQADATAKAAAAQSASLAAAISHANAQAAYEREVAIANADGKISAEEQARITQAQNNLTAAYNDATNKANAAAQYGLAAQALHNALVSNLRSLAYEDVVEVGKLGSTVIQGGFIKTTLLDAEYIKASIINAQYINALVTTSTTLQTSASGKRIVISGANNNMIFYDQENHEALRIDANIDAGTAGNPLGGMRMTTPADDVAYCSGNGFFANGSGMQFFSLTTGRNTNASVVGMLRYKNSDTSGISAGVVGIDVSPAGNSKSYAVASIGNTLLTGSIATNIDGTGLGLTGRFNYSLGSQVYYNEYKNGIMIGNGLVS